MEKQHDAGFFCAALTGTPARYLLQAKLWDGATVEFEDPYRFRPLITDFDLHLHTEGTHYEAYHTLGAHLVEVDGVKGVRFAVWAPNAETSPWPASSTSGTRAAIPCGGATAASGRSSCPGSARAPPTSTTSARASPATSS